MNVVRKDATISNTGGDDDFPGTFEVILSTKSLDRDGDELLTEDWEQPLPDHITFDNDHGMSVASTVGSGTPSIDADGRLVVSGSYSSLDRAQETRTLVKEGHIRTTSVAFMTKKVTKGGKSRTVRELLNGAFVAIPSNRDALVTSSKAGARNSKSDAQHIQAIHDSAIALGAKPADTTGAAAGATGGKTVSRRMVAAKAVDGSYEQRQQAISDAVSARYGDEMWAYPIATFDDSVVYRVSGSSSSDLRGQWQADYTVDDDGVVTLGDPVRVNMVEQFVPVKSYAPDDDDLTDIEESETPSADNPAKPEEGAAVTPADDDAEDLNLKYLALVTRATALAAI